jgi:hypothetical protein
MGTSSRVTALMLELFHTTASMVVLSRSVELRSIMTGVEEEERKKERRW